MKFRFFTVLFFVIIPFVSVYAQQGIATVYSEETQKLLDNFRTVALEKPDSCKTEFDILVKHATKVGEYYAIAKALNINGIGYAYQNNIPKAIELFMDCNEFATKLPPSDILVDCRNNIANMYITQGDTAQSLFYFNLGMEAATAFGNFDREILTAVQLASLEIDCGKIDAAYLNLEKIRARYQNITAIDIKAYYHIARSRYFSEKEMHDSAMVEAKIGLEQYESLNDVIGMTTCNFYVGMNYLKTGNTAKAIQHCQTSYTIADTSNLIIWQSQSCECLWQAHKAAGNYEKALSYHLRLTEINETVKNDERIRDIAKVELQLEFKKERFEDSLKTAEQAATDKSAQDVILQNEQSKSRLLYFGLAFLAIIALLLYRSFRSKKRDNQIILEQKNTVVQKQHEILDSIAYAKRLQDAILPSATQLSAVLSDNFVFYSPKDVVSGDFYWFDQVRSLSNKSSTILLAAADCTGHGVPGAMVSVVCSNALRRTVKEFGLIKPGDILDKVASIVEETFENDQNEVKDGMDIALISINPSVNDDEKSAVLEFSGANNPLWIVRETKKLSQSERENLQHVSDENNQLTLIEIKGDRQPVGKFANKKPFQTSEISLLENDVIYIFTDGFPDQFGGPKGKKFKYQTFKKLLLSNAHLAMKEQKRILTETMAGWQKEFEQTDDICVIGVKI